MKAFHPTTRAVAKLLLVIALGIASVVVALPADAATPKCGGREATILGTNGDDELTGTRGRDVIAARGGIDIVESRGGNDFVCLGGGPFDVAFTAGGNDTIFGGRGFDVIFPGSGNDFIDGGASNGDFVTYEGSLAPVTGNLATGVITGQGEDRLRSVEGIGGSEADDTLIGNDRGNALWGMGGNDIVRARGGNDFLNAGAGDDTLVGGTGHDTLDLLTAQGGPALGDDVFATSGVAVDLAAGTAVGGADVGTDGFTGIEDVGTTLGNDTVVGTDGDNFIITFDGTDSVQAGAGDDLVAPGAGDDTVDGGDGADLVDYFVSDIFQPGVLGPVAVNLMAGTATGVGTDTLTSIEGVFGTLHDDTLVGSNADNLFVGDEGSDTIMGNDGDDFLDGDIFFFGFPDNMPGTDSLDGGLGEDTCFGGETAVGCETTARGGLPGSRGDGVTRVLARYRTTRTTYAATLGIR
jgi:Ca2+-binding RTX toxin-like protein